MRISQAERREKREGHYARIMSPAETSSSLDVNAKNLYWELELGRSVHCRERTELSYGNVFKEQRIGEWGRGIPDSDGG